MLLVLLVLLTLALLVGIIYGLRRNQLRENESNADRQSPLPPLDLTAVAPLNVDDDEDAALSPRNRRAPINTRGSLDDRPASDIGAHVRATAGLAPVSATDFEEPGSLPVINANWLQECNRLKTEGRYEEALEACETAMPQAGAFNQAATILRAQIRHAQKAGQDISPLLQDLYLVASYASFLHDKQVDLPALKSHQVRQLPASAWQIDMPYSNIGYRNLRLLTKSDTTLLREYWGEPEQHQSPRSFHQVSWLRLVQVYG